MTTLRPPLDLRAPVATPEQFILPLRIVGPARRALAWLLDKVVQAVLIGIVGLPVALAWDEEAGVGGMFLLLLLFLLEWVYGTVFEAFGSGQTPGKMWMRIRVVRVDGTTLDFNSALLRNLLRAVDFLPFGYALGGLATLTLPRFARFGDLVAGTMVVDSRVSSDEDSVDARESTYGVDPDLIPSRVSLKVSEMRAIEALLWRSSRMSPGRQDEIALPLAHALRERLNIESSGRPTAWLAALLLRAQRSEE